MNKTSAIIPTELGSFLNQLDQEYRSQLTQLSLFNPEKTAKWNQNQLRLFAGVFYHIRGYFINFMWHMANFSSDKGIKQLILDNIAEEIGLNAQYSHEMLYARFAKECGIDIQDEIINQTHHMPFVKAFNHEHLRWLAEQNAKDHIAAFSAYERLDNIDYVYLAAFGESLSFSQHDLAFFNVHIHVKHFESTTDKLITLWEHNPTKVKEAFHFIYHHQLTMWQQLSNQF
jgi:pyrroloquinoline quinone (PQQ) biosynthesis protein C